MHTIGGGTVRYVDIELLPCPEDPARFGQCQGAGRLEVLWRGRVVESFDLRAGDELLVADGCEVVAETPLIDREPWSRTLRAAIPDGIEAIVQWSEPIERDTDQLTGIMREHFARTNAPLAVTLFARDGGALATHAVSRDASPRVGDGAIVRRGDRLATIPRYRRRCELDADSQTVVAWLDTRRVGHEPTAVVAPCDATVIDLGQRWIVLRSHAGRVLRLRRPPQPWLGAVVAVGDTVRAGEVLTGGERHHRALLHAWGPERLSEHLLDELELLCGSSVPRVYWALAVRAMLRGQGLRGIAELARQKRAQSGFQRSL